MDRGSVTWRGYWVAAPTPFTRDGELDLGALREVLRLYVDQGVHGILINGSTGEWFAQTEDERRRVAEAAVRAVGDRVPIVVGCTTFTPTCSRELAQHAAAIGAAGVLATPPPYAVPTDDEILYFFESFTSGAEAPVMVYNWPRGTNVDIGPALVGKLAQLNAVVALKDSTADRERAAANLAVAVETIRVFGSFIDARGLTLLRQGAGDGTIDGGGLAAPLGVAFWEAVWAAAWDEASVVADHYLTLTRAFVNPDWSGRFGSPVSQLKAVMRLVGQPAGYPRPPLLPMDEAPPGLQCYADHIRAELSGHDKRCTERSDRLPVEDVGTRLREDERLGRCTR
ncbi:MAG: dihydrodipicolinate synthase family protein [Candidatus Dormiibacterota bacterium]